jgi:uncharacterized membrane protein
MDHTGEPAPSRAASRAAWALLGLNAALALFSLVGSLALETGRPVPPWDYGRLSSAIAVLNVLVGFAAALIDLGATRGARAVLLLLGLCVFVAGGSELAGTLTGIPFGRYEYTGKLGPRFVGEVPYLIPLAWFTIGYASLSVAGTLAVPRSTAAVFAASMVVVWDVALDPAMTAKYPAWLWTDGGLFYGIPFTNYVAWFVVALVIAGVYLCLARPAPASSTRLPWALYTVQSVFPAALATVYGRGGATVAWAIGFAAIVVVSRVLGRPPGAGEPAAPRDPGAVRQ